MFHDQAFVYSAFTVFLSHYYFAKSRTPIQKSQYDEGCLLFAYFIPGQKFALQLFIASITKCCPCTQRRAHTCAFLHTVQTEKLKQKPAAPTPALIALFENCPHESLWFFKPKVHSFHSNYKTVPVSLILFYFLSTLYWVVSVNFEWLKYSHVFSRQIVNRLIQN